LNGLATSAAAAHPTGAAGAPPPLVFLLDVDNTLLDSERFGADLHASLVTAFGMLLARRFAAINTELRERLGYVDTLGALQRLRFEVAHQPGAAMRLVHLGRELLDYAYAERLFPQALAVLAHLGRLGQTVILTDGDVVYQPHKLVRAGLWDAVQGRVMVCVHKEQELAEVAARHPAAHHVMVDDKPHVLAAMKAAWGERLTTVLVRQGHYCLDAEAATAADPLGHPAPWPADVTVAHIGELLAVPPGQFRARRPTWPGPNRHGTSAAFNAWSPPPASVPFSTSSHRLASQHP
jgi:FMN phosphatase YigB (HAD superfamily)